MDSAFTGAGTPAINRRVGKGSSTFHISKNLSTFWTNFYPDIPTPDDVFPDDDEGLDVLDDTLSQEDTDDSPDDQDDDASSEVSNISAQWGEDFMSVIPLKFKLLPGKLHLLNPKIHRLPADSTYTETPVNTVIPIMLRSSEGEWYFNTLKKGIHLPRPKDAPALFRTTKPSPLMDTVVNTWVENGLLVPSPNFKYAQPMFLVPKQDKQVRPIIDYSEWTPFIKAPRFSLLTAGSAIRKILLDNLMVKIDLRSGFHQLPLARSTFNHNGICYRGTKYSLTRLPTAPQSTK